jgi:hypothetical protein
MSQQINLYNPAFLKRNPALEPGALLAYALATVLALAGGAALITRVERNRLEAEVAALGNQIKTEQERITLLAAQRAARKRDPALDAEVARLDAQVRSRGASQAAISSGALGSTRGFSGHMRALARQSVNGLWLTGFSIAGGGADVVLRGRMLDAGLLPQYLARLGAEPAFEGKAFASLSIAQPPAAGVDAAAPARYLGFEISTRDATARAQPDGAAPEVRK